MFCISVNNTLHSQKLTKHKHKVAARTVIGFMVKTAKTHNGDR